MQRVAIIGDRDTVQAFRGLGMKVVVTEDATVALQQLEVLAADQYGIIYVTEPLAAAEPLLLERYSEALLPAVIAIPSCRTEAAEGSRRLRELVKRAVGIDLLAEEQVSDGSEA